MQSDLFTYPSPESVIILLLVNTFVHYIPYKELYYAVYSHSI